MAKKYNYIIVGSGIIGLSIARTLKERNPAVQILMIDKEEHEAYHASSRNSGVLHAGFYYTADSLKAKLTVEGSKAWIQFCEERKLPINRCGKLVVAQNEEELAMLSELEQRGKRNGSTVEIISAERAKELEPNVRTFQKALYSPHTASIDPKLMCGTLRKELEEEGVEFLFCTKFIRPEKSVILTTQGDYACDTLINCAGLYADKIAHAYGLGEPYTLLPFKGLYLKYTKNTTDVKMHLYPVPNLKNPFLGVHFTKTVDGTIKIGPTATPAFWREHYGGMQRFSLREFFEVTTKEAQLFCTNAFGFRSLAMEEIRKYNKDYLVDEASKMVQSIDKEGFTEYTQPGIRAQLLDRRTNKLVQDFVVERDERSVHLLNAISPAFSCSFKIAEYVIDNYLS